MSLSRTWIPQVSPALTDSQSLRLRVNRGAPLQLQRGNSLPRRIAVIGNHMPRQCGIATFTTDLCDALESRFGSAHVFAVPVNDPHFAHKYPPRVRFELTQSELSSYEMAKNFLNLRNPDVVCLQHEYGIFGGAAGSHILQLLRGLRSPVVTTLHTVLSQPNSDQRRVMEEIADLSARLVVMSRHSSRLLQNVFDIPASKIDLIPHGVPDLPFADPDTYKEALGVAGKTVLLSFGLLSPNKGVENIIAALPEIVSRQKNVVLLVVGATHPHLMQREGDRYLSDLKAMTHNLGVEAHVEFRHKFVSPGEMAQYIGAADIYITPYRHEAQVSSGTLAYALGAGKAIISTPYWHAAELLADGRGALVPFENPGAIATQAIQLLENQSLRDGMRKSAYTFGRTMVWRDVARQYMDSFQRARAKKVLLSPNGMADAVCQSQAS